MTSLEQFIIQVIVSLLGGGAMGALINIRESRRRSREERELHEAERQARVKEEKEQRETQLKARREKILTALKIQVASIRAVSETNTTATGSEPPPPHVVSLVYPTSEIENAIFSENGINVSENTLKSAVSYVVKARQLNAVIERLYSAHLAIDLAQVTEPAKQQMRRFIHDQVTKDLAAILDKLEFDLGREMI